MRIGGVANTMTHTHTVSMSVNKQATNVRKWMNSTHSHSLKTKDLHGSGSSVSENFPRETAPSCGI